MSDAESSMRYRPFFADESLMPVTVFVESYRFPFYNVYAGRLGNDGIVQVDDVGKISRKDVLNIAPIEVFEKEHDTRVKLENNYRTNKINLKKKMLSDFNIDFIEIDELTGGVK